MAGEIAAARSNWTNVTVDGEARAHLGDSYVTNNFSM
jgi:hypothetical protein